MEEGQIRTRGGGGVIRYTCLQKLNIDGVTLPDPYTVLMGGFGRKMQKGGPFQSSETYTPFYMYTQESLKAYNLSPQRRNVTISLMDMQLTPAQD